MLKHLDHSCQGYYVEIIVNEKAVTSLHYSFDSRARNIEETI
jgi:hypothetical protein